MRIAAMIVAMLPLSLAACGPSQPAAGPPPARTAAAAAAGSAPAPGLRRFDSATYGFRIDYPSTLAASESFGSSYLANGTWKTYAGPDSSGTPVLDLVLPKSNSITAGELRIGVSDVAGELAQCTTPPDAVRAGSVGHQRIGDADFTTFEAADAAMSHYLSVRSYRVVHAGRCYAIDLLVTGTNPQVYDPPATPPFTADQAFARLQQVVQGFRFTR
ncbi:MAG TPA: hypothetical protein VFJ04_00170 [Rhodanobacteraceae bacterium]|nr:hypothetical protein [Rhodanobacteraceae bacterium]